MHGRRAGRAGGECCFAIWSGGADFAGDFGGVLLRVPSRVSQPVRDAFSQDPAASEMTIESITRLTKEGLVDDARRVGGRGEHDPRPPRAFIAIARLADMNLFSRDSRARARTADPGLNLAMRDGGGGSIVNMGSVTSQVGFPNISAYVAAKHGVLCLTKTAAIDHAAEGIRINSSDPRSSLPTWSSRQWARQCSKDLPTCTRSVGWVPPRRSPNSSHGWPAMPPRWLTGAFIPLTVAGSRSDIANFPDLCASAIPNSSSPRAVRQERKSSRNRDSPPGTRQRAGNILQTDDHGRCCRSWFSGETA